MKNNTVSWNVKDVFPATKMSHFIFSRAVLLLGVRSSPFAVFQLVAGGPSVYFTNY
jgi:hypothetical protein